MGPLAETILTFVGIVAVGALLRALKVVRAEDTRPLNAVIIYVGLPSFIFRAVYGVDLDADLAVVVAIAWASFLVTLGCAWAIAHGLKLAPALAGAFMLAAALGNTGYIGYPVTEALLGADAVSTAVFYDVFGTVFALVLVGLPIAQRLGASGRTLAHPLRELGTFPAVVALVAALLLRSVPIPDLVRNGLELCASMVAPLIMLTVGMALRPRAIAGYGAAIVAVALLRLAVSPAVAALGATAALDGEMARVVVLEGSVPTMMLTLAVSERFGLDQEFAAAAVFVTTALSALTIPLWQALVF